MVQIDAEHNMTTVMQQALKNNSVLDISGMMYYSPATREVFQVLEGPECKVLALYDTICSDSRHTDVKLVKSEYVSEFISQRQYEDWGMALIRTPAPLEALQAHHASIIAGLPVRLHYTSTLLATSAEHARTLISDIVSHAFTNNSSLKISGLLLFSPETKQALPPLDDVANESYRPTLSS